ncbi:hypothetical protein BH09ACT8_BH09ACT8_48330 [soil metagenome]
MAFTDVVGSGYGTVKRQVESTAAGRSPATFWWRIALLAVLFCGAYGVVLVQVLNDAVGGSRTAFLVVAPVLVALGVTGYRTVPRGVGDNESDWIIAAVTGVVGLTAIALITNRYPTLAGMWRLELVGALVWVACAGMVIFSVRHVVRMWQVWLFALICATTAPYLLVTASLGGSDTAAASVAAGLGAIAVYLAGRPNRRRWRITAALISLALGVGTAVVLTAAVGLFVTVLVATGIVPVAVAIGLHYFSTAAESPTPAAVSAGFHPLSPRSLVVLAILAVVLFATQMGTPRQQNTPSVNNDWAQRAGLTAPEGYGFVGRFLGPDATLVRYTVPGSAKAPAAVVDVLSTPNLAALLDYSDAVWYPSPVPVNIAPFDAEQTDHLPLSTRVLHSNADAATAADPQNWYALTWVWKTDTAYQQVTVVVNQAVASPEAPIDPQPLTESRAILEPLLWVARQQPESIGEVDPRVVARADNVMSTLVGAAAPARGSDEPNRG